MTLSAAYAGASRQPTVPPGHAAGYIEVIAA